MITVAGRHLSLEQLQNMDLVRPKRAGTRWQGICHADLVSTLHSALRNRGIERLKETWSTDKTGQSLAGGVNVRFPECFGIEGIPGMDFS